MKKINIVRSNREFNNIIHTGKKYVGNIFYVYMLKNDVIKIISLIGENYEK